MYLILAGGTGSIKLVRGFDNANIISNVGDNIWLYGLYICPDIDTIMYGLADILDKNRGWGIKNDTFNFMKQLRYYGIDTWFSIGDKDLATHILRSEMIREGKRLSEITDILRRRLSIGRRILPATDDRVETYIESNNGIMHLQEFWVKHKGMLDVKNVFYKGIDDAKASDYVLDLIANAERIVIAPANPISSINPIISIKDIRKALIDARDKCIAVSPIIGTSAISGPAAKYMQALGYDVSIYGIADLYSSITSSLVIDKSDEKYSNIISTKFDIDVYITDIVMRNNEDERRLADFIKNIK
ncbi:MAG: 2-phospho-L-lactate transferase [Candidatus Nitrosocaldaceae archaeon]